MSWFSPSALEVKTTESRKCGTMALVDFENRGMAIVRLCASQSGQDVDSGPRCTMLYKRTSNHKHQLRRSGRFGRNRCGTAPFRARIRTHFAKILVATRETNFS